MSNCQKKCEKDSSALAIPYIAHEAALAREERTIKRLWITVILLIVLFVASNTAWLIYESQYEDISQIVTQEGTTGINSFIGGDMLGEANYNYS